jgi:hypothetical protein
MAFWMAGRAQIPMFDWNLLSISLPSIDVVAWPIDFQADVAREQHALVACRAYQRVIDR